MKKCILAKSAYSWLIKYFISFRMPLLLVMGKLLSKLHSISIEMKDL